MCRNIPMDIRVKKLQNYSDSHTKTIAQLIGLALNIFTLFPTKCNILKSMYY